MEPINKFHRPGGDQYCSVYADILSQAVTGEFIGMQNFASMVELFDDVEEKLEAVEHANNEMGHGLAFRKAAKDLGVDIIVDIDAPYWKRIRSAFLKWARLGDLSACMLIQEIMLESFAVSMYYEVGSKADNNLADVFNRIAAEEEGHLQHAVDFFQVEIKRDPISFEKKVHHIHNDVMTVLAEMVGKQDASGHCGLCKGECVKDSLHHVDLNIADMRGKALNHYLKSLDRLGLRGEKTLEWVAKLPV